VLCLPNGQLAFHAAWLLSGKVIISHIFLIKKIRRTCVRQFKVTGSVRPERPFGRRSVRECGPVSNRGRFPVETDDAHPASVGID